MPTAVRTPPAIPRPHRFTIQEYLAMGEAGIFRPEDRVELFRGEVVEMSPIGSEHVGAVLALCERLQRQAPEGIRVAGQNAVNIGNDNQVQPDVAVVRWTDRVWDEGVTGRDCLLVVEVANSSLAYDRGRKLELYAEAGVPEYWVLDLRKRAVEVYRQPDGLWYRERRVVTEAETLEVSALPGVRLRVGEVLPPR